MRKTHMLHIIRTFARTLAVVTLAAAIAPSIANAAPSARNGQKNVTFQLNNNGAEPLQVKVDGQMYTIAPHDGLKMAAPAGADVYAASDGPKVHSGDKLFSVTKDLKGKIIWID
jgi:murein DD-endopeptidase MepM/ murein hydrolase activator NlpD